MKRIGKLLCLTLLLSGCAGTVAHRERHERNLGQAVSLCQELAGAAGGNDDAHFWLDGAREDISRTFWSNSGVAFLDHELDASPTGVRRSCIEQLAREARAERVEP